jgi:hypothetical protein
MIGSDFVPYVMKYKRFCGECHKPMLPGDTVLASIRGGKVKKYVCSEDCRRTFDDGFWQGRARDASVARRLGQH